MAIPTVKVATSQNLVDHDWRWYHQEVQTGNVTADKTVKVLAPFAGRFTDPAEALLALGTSGADGTDPLDMELDVQINGTSIFATKPKIEDTAANGATSRAAGTGITLGVLSATAANLEFDQDDIISIIMNITRTTPETELADVMVLLSPKRTADFDRDIGVARS